MRDAARCRHMDDPGLKCPYVDTATKEGEEEQLWGKYWLI